MAEPCADPGRDRETREVGVLAPSGGGDCGEVGDSSSGTIDEDEMFERNDDDGRKSRCGRMACGRGGMAVGRSMALAEVGSSDASACGGC